MKKDFLPRKETAIIQWANLYKNKLPGVATQLGLTIGEVTDQQNLCQEIIDSFNAHYAAKTTAKSKKKAKTATMKKNLNILRRRIANIKTRDTYSEGTGKGLGVVGVDVIVKAAEIKPELWLKVSGGFVIVDFTKKGLEGVNVFSKLPADAEFEKLALDMHPPYVDTRPLRQPGVPEEREYMVIGVMKDKPVGQPSNIATILYAG